MFEIYILVIIFISCIVFVYKKFYGPQYELGEWLTVDKDIKIENDINWDVSDKSVVRVVNLKKWRRYFFGSDLFVTIKEKEGLALKFDHDCILDVCDDMMNNIHHIVNPDLIILSDEEDPRVYRLESHKKYLFFMRTDTDKNLESKIYKFKDIQKAKITGKRKTCQMCYLDEDDLFGEFYKECEKIRNAMALRGYNLVKIGKSNEYLSFPNNSISNKLEIESELGDVLILVTTNKSITSEMKNHSLEINSSNNSFNWKPEDTKSICHLLLDNCDQDDKFCFYERTTNIKNGSNILPFQVLVFQKNR
jgi:hypothetical protein